MAPDILSNEIPSTKEIILPPFPQWAKSRRTYIKDNMERIVLSAPYSVAICWALWERYNVYKKMKIEVIGE
jgi:hypothetical protein